jgi:hypothetical protein
MTVFNDCQVRGALKKKRFKEEPKDHNFYFLYINGKRTSINTHTSHNQQDINDHLINCMKKQLKLDKKDFENLINCPLSFEKYVQILKDNNEIEL